MPWIIDYYSEEVRLEIDALPVGIRASYTRLTELLEEFGLGPSHAPFTGNGRRAVRTSTKRARGNSEGILLHESGQENHHAPLIHQEDERNTEAGA